jgi:transposase
MQPWTRPPGESTAKPPLATPAKSLLLSSRKSSLCVPGRKQIHIILDNLSAHKTTSVREFLEQNPRVQFHFTPTYSSWLNQVELWFAKIEREVIARGIFTSVPDLARKLRRYINAYSANARPFQWKYSDPTRRIRSNEFTGTGHLGYLRPPR